MSTTCSACGASNLSNSEFCEACGCELEASSFPIQTDTPIQSSSSPLACLYSSTEELLAISTESSSSTDTDVPAKLLEEEIGLTTARLITKQAGAPISEFTLESNNLIGRFDPDTGPVDIDLENFSRDDSIISRNHAEIYSESGCWKVKDLGSINGVFIKPMGESRFGNRITFPTEVKNGDEISFGNIRFIFRSP